MVTRQEYEKLCDEVWKHNRLYFQEGKPVISDDEFDKLVKKVEAIEAAHPDWISDTSPIQRVGEKPLSGFEEVVHSRPMLSLEKAFSKEELEDFDKRMKRLLNVVEIDYSVEVKLDGLAIAVTYEHGHFAQAVTRGDGKIGSDVTQNLKTLRHLPLRLGGEHLPKKMEVRGEVYLPKAAFEKMNSERAKEGLQLWANPRNAAAGSLKLLDPKEVAKRSDLSVAFYGVADESVIHVKRQTEVHSYLKSIGLPVVELFKKCHSVAEVMQFAHEIEKKRPTLPYGIDGLVIKVNDLKAYESLGTTGKHPRGAIAYKFAAEQAWTTIEGITIQVGRTGVLTPVAELKPVFLDGSTISRATLHNFDELERKDIRVGDTVSIEKGGDVIPKVVVVDPSKRHAHAKSFVIPKVCPACGEKVTKDPEEVAYRCTNRYCPAQKLRKLIHFAGKGGLDIENLGIKVMEQLVNKGFVESFADIFTLTAKEVGQLDGFKDKSIHNLLTSIEKAKKTTLAQLLMALGIRHVGEQAAELLAEHARSLSAVEKMSLDELIALPGIGEKMASSIVEYFADLENKKEIEKLLKSGLHCKEVQISASKDHPFYNKMFVLTGTLERFSRHEAEQKIKAVGGKVSDSVSKKTDYVVCGSDPGSKLEKAKKLGVPVLSEQDFVRQLK